MKRLVEGGWIWTGGDHDRDRLIEDGAVLIAGERIEAVLTREERSSYPISREVERIDGSGKLIIPGLINAHTHLYSSLARGMALSHYSPRTFTQILEQLWWRLDKALDPESATWRTGALAPSPSRPFPLSPRPRVSPSLPVSPSPRVSPSTTTFER